MQEFMFRYRSRLIVLAAWLALTIFSSAHYEVSVQGIDPLMELFYVALYCLAAVVVFGGGFLLIGVVICHFTRESMKHELAPWYLLGAYISLGQIAYLAWTTESVWPMPN